MKAKDRVTCLLALSGMHLSAKEISDICWIGSWRLYSILADLENKKMLASYFEAGGLNGPRRRLYKWNPNQ